MEITLHLKKIRSSDRAINRREVASACTNLVVIYCYVDFDGDDMISKDDLQQVIQRLTGEQQLSDDDMEQLIKNVCCFVIFLCWNSWIAIRNTGATSLAYILTRFALFSWIGLIYNKFQLVSCSKLHGTPQYPGYYNVISLQSPKSHDQHIQRNMIMVARIS